jgi:hypothetical protein
MLQVGATGIEEEDDDTVYDVSIIPVFFWRY